MSTMNRLSWRLGPRPVPLDDYRVMLRDMLAAVAPVADWDPRAGLAQIDELTEAEQRLALERWFGDVEARLTCLRVRLDRMAQIHPPDGSLMELHLAAIMLGADYAGCIGQRIDGLKCADANDDRARECKRRSQEHRAHLASDSAQLARHIDRLRRHHPELHAKLDLPFRYAA